MLKKVFKFYNIIYTIIINKLPKFLWKHFQKKNYIILVYILAITSIKF